MMHLFILLLAIWPFSYGKPVAEAVISVEDLNGNNVLMWQQTGDKGKASIRHLNQGSYRLVVAFPELDGKWVKNRSRHHTSTKASFNPKTRTYYYQGTEGCFSLKLNTLRKIKKEDFVPVFKELRQEDSHEYVVAEIQAHRPGAGLTITVKKLTPRQFKKVTDKTGNDISSLYIPGIR